MTKKTPLRLTQKTIAKLPAGEYADAEKKELYLLVGKTGATWYFRKTHNYKTIRAAIGSAENITREQAIKQCEIFSGNLAKTGTIHANATDILKGSAKVPTFGEALRGYREDRKNAGKTPARDYGRLTAWENTPITQINRTTCITIAESIAAEGHPVMANRIISCIRAVYNYLIREGMWDKINPAAKIKRFTETPRRIYLEKDETCKLIDILNKFRSDGKKKKGAEILLLCIYTWKRISNVCDMLWSEVDLENNLWCVPEDKAKGRRAIDCPLSPEAAEILKSLQAADPQTPFVFPAKGNAKGSTGHPRKVWSAALKAAGISENIHRHDIRHTMASWALRAGVPLETVSEQLDHKDVSFTARVYAHVMTESKREAISATLSVLGKGDQNG